MKTLIIILIVVMIAQTVLFIYSNIIDLTNRRSQTAAQEVMKNAHADFCNEKKRFAEILAKKDETIRELTSDKVKMTAEIIERGKRIKHLENDVLNPDEKMQVVWRPTIEQIKSVHDAASVMMQMKLPAASTNLIALWEALKKQYQNSEEGDV